MRRFSLLTLVIVASLVATGQPEWLDTGYRITKFPANDYLTGFATVSASSSDPALFKDAETFAVLDLGQALFLTVTTIPGVSYYSAEMISQEQLTEAGLVTEVHYDSLQKVIFAFSTLSKKSLIKNAYLQMRSWMDEIKASLIALDGLPSNADKLKSISDASSKLILARSRNELLHRLSVENATVLMNDQFLLYQKEIARQLKQMKESNSGEISQTLNVLAQSFAYEVDIRKLGIRPVYFKNTTLTSSLSKYIENQLTAAMRTAGFQLISSSPFRLTGNYWVRDDEVQVTLNIREYSGNEAVRLLASESFFIPITNLQELGMAFIPVEGHQARVSSSFMMNAPNGGLNSDVLTQKGSRGLIFEVEENMQLMVRSSRPAFVTLINVWDNGSQVLLMENYYIGEDRVNQDIELPFDWVVQCPCGTEYIKMLAQRDPFDEMSAKATSEGFDMIEEDVEISITRIRDAQRSLQKRDPQFYFGESNLVITTME